jgi:hypothetical protein
VFANTALPVIANVRETALPSVPPKLIVVPVSAAFAPKVAFPLYVWIPVVVTTPPLIPVVRLTVTDVRGVTPPTAPLNIAAPVIPSVQPLSNVPPKVTMVPVSVVFAP